MSGMSWHENVKEELALGSTNRFLLDLLIHLDQHARKDVGVHAAEFLSKQVTNVGYWPGDEEVTRALEELPAYNRLRQPRLRMVLEAIEDHLRGYPDGRFAEGPITRNRFAIEHIMPQEWRRHWKVESTSGDEDEVDRLVQTLGNLTLVTKAFNSQLSNAGWLGPKGKRANLDKLSSLLVTRPVVRDHESSWSVDDIRKRTRQLIEYILAIWPVPTSHTPRPSPLRERTTYPVTVADLIRAELLRAGATLYAKPRASRPHTADVSEDGRIWVDGVPFDTPSGAAKAVSGNQQPGWHFWATDPKFSKTLVDLRDEYLAGVDDNIDEQLLDED
jgi:hypothetical protein